MEFNQMMMPPLWCGSSFELASSLDPFFLTAASPCWWSEVADGFPFSGADSEWAPEQRCGGAGLGSWLCDGAEMLLRRFGQLGGRRRRDAEAPVWAAGQRKEKGCGTCRDAACGMTPFCTRDLEDKHWLKRKEVKLQLLNWNSTINHPHQPLESSPGCDVISRYEIFALSYELEMVEDALGSIQHDAQKLDCINWNQQNCVNLWFQDNINWIHTHGLSVKGRTRDLIVTNIGEVLNAELKSYVDTLYMILRQIVGNAIYTVEQDLISKFSCTGLCCYDDKHDVGTVPVVRVDPPAVDDNTTVEVPQIQQQGHLRLSSVMVIQYLQLNTPLPQMQTPDRLLGEPPAGQLVWSIEAFEGYNCGTFGSGLSTDGRSPFGFFCSLRCQNYVLLPSFREFCHFSYLILL